MEQTVANREEENVLNSSLTISLTIARSCGGAVQRQE